MTMISHGKRVAKLGRPADQRKALLRALTTEIIRHGRVKTTLIRARAVRPFVDKMISLSKEGSLHSRRQVRPNRMGSNQSKSLSAIHVFFSPGSFWLLA